MLFNIYVGPEDAPGCGCSICDKVFAPAPEPPAITQIRAVLSNPRGSEYSEDNAFALALLRDERVLTLLVNSPHIPGIRTVVLEVLERRGLWRSELEKALKEYDALPR